MINCNLAFSNENIKYLKYYMVSMLFCRRAEGEQTMYIKETSNSTGVVTTYEVFHAKYIWKKVLHVVISYLEGLLS
jgi:hypothetical protein